MEVCSRREEHDVRVELASEDFSKECPEGDLNTISDSCYSGSGLPGATQVREATKVNTPITRTRRHSPARSGVVARMSGTTSLAASIRLSHGRGAQCRSGCRGRRPGQRAAR